MPITIVGPDSIHGNYNDVFYKVKNACKNDIEINQTGNVDKHQLRKILNEHDIIIHPSSIETGQPSTSRISFSRHFARLREKG